MRKGFTLIETILYIAIVAAMLVAISRFGWTVVNSGIKSRSQEESAGAARYLSERIKYEIRNASGFTLNSASSITLNNIPSGTTTIDLVSGKVRINTGSGAVNLNSDDTTVSELTFTNNSSGDNKTKNISFVLTVTTAYAGSSQLFEASTRLRTSSEIRSNY